LTIEEQIFQFKVAMHILKNDCNRQSWVERWNREIWSTTRICCALTGLKMDGTCRWSLEIREIANFAACNYSDHTGSYLCTRKCWFSASIPKRRGYLHGKIGYLLSFHDSTMLLLCDWKEKGIRSYMSHKLIDQA
jgi:hypothetical protein